MQEFKENFKKLKKKTELTQQQALNKVTLELTGFDTWENLPMNNKNASSFRSRMNCFVFLFL